MSYRSFHPVCSDDLPEDLRADFKWICDQLTKYDEMYLGQKKTLEQAGREDLLPGSVPATLSRIKKKTGVKIADRIFKIYVELEERIGSLRS